MTPEQIRARCVKFLVDPEHEFNKRTDGLPFNFQVDILESLYREAMAAGLEMAAAVPDERVEIRNDLEGTPAKKARDSIRNDECQMVADTIRYKAQAIKGGAKDCVEGK